MMSSKLQVSRLCQKQEESVFLRATLPGYSYEPEKSKTVGHAKLWDIKNPRSSHRIGSSHIRVGRVVSGSDYYE
jgi:hypothetical protein